MFVGSTPVTFQGVVCSASSAAEGQSPQGASPPPSETGTGSSRRGSALALEDAVKAASISVGVSRVLGGSEVLLFSFSFDPLAAPQDDCMPLSESGIKPMQQEFSAKHT